MDEEGYIWKIGKSDSHTKESSMSISIFKLHMYIFTSYMKNTIFCGYGTLGSRPALFSVKVE
jgi:hypothetical protein